MSSVGHGMFSYIPDSSMIGTVFCNFIANAMYAHSVYDFHHCTMFNTVCRCVAYSVIDVQLELQGAAWNLSDHACQFQSNYTNKAAQHLSSRITFSVGGLQVHSSAAASPVTRLPFSLVTHQYGQPKHFLFSKLASGSFSIRAIAIVHGKSAVCFSCTDPEPNIPLCTEQRALVSYMEAVTFAVCKCPRFDVACSCQLTRGALVSLSASCFMLQAPSFCHHSHLILQLPCKPKPLQL